MKYDWITLGMFVWKLRLELNVTCLQSGQIEVWWSGLDAIKKLSFTYWLKDILIYFETLLQIEKVG